MEALACFFAPFHDYSIPDLDPESAFEWLSEIEEAIATACVDKKKGLQPLPKTPSVQNKRKRNARKPPETVNEDCDQPVSKKANVRQLKFDLEVECNEPQDTVENIDVSGTGRPMRRCRSSKNLIKPPPSKKPSRMKMEVIESDSPEQAAVPCPKKPSRKKKEVIESDSPEQTVVLPPKKPSRKKKGVNDIDSPGPAVAESQAPSHLVSPHSENAKQQIISSGGQRPQAKRNAAQVNIEREQSPSVKDIVKNFEKKQQERNTRDPVSRNKIPTNLASPAATCKTVENLKSTAIEIVDSPISRCHSSEKQQRRTKSNAGKDSKEQTSDGAAARPRTRLRLNKQPAKPAKKSVPGDSKLDSQESGDDMQCEQEHSDSDVDMVEQNSSGDVSAPNTSLSETQVIISEEYELFNDGKQAKLKHIECVKTKTTPVCLPKDSQSIQMNTVSSSVHSEGETAASTDEDDEENCSPDTRQKINKKLLNNNSNHKTQSTDSGIVAIASGKKADSTFTCNSEEDDTEIERSTRTRTRQPKDQKVVIKSGETSADSGTEDVPLRSTRTRQRIQEKVNKESPTPVSLVFDGIEKDQVTPPAHSVQAKQRMQEPEDVSQKSVEQEGEASARSTRTRQRAQEAETVEPEEEAPVRSTRTRQRAQEAEPAKPEEEAPVRSTRTRQRAQEAETAEPEEEAPVRSTRTRQRAQEAAAEDAKATEGQQRNKREDKKGDLRSLALYDNDDVVAGSPGVTVYKAKTPVRSVKRHSEHERGLSPAPKRQRSILGDEDAPLPLSSSSLLRNDDEAEERDTVSSTYRPAYSFNSSQRQTSGFLNRTPGFNQNTKRLYSFINKTPTTQTGSASAVRSFLKKASPSPQMTFNTLQEQRKKMLAEKQKKELERIKKQKEEKQRRLEERQKERAERERIVKANRLEKEEKQKQLTQHVVKKQVVIAKAVSRINEERERDEAEKRRQREQKQFEADQRRRQEEREKIAKHLEMEEEDRRQRELLQKKRKEEEQLRKQKLAEEMQKVQQRKAEQEQKEQEERERARQAQIEKDREIERIRIERENQMQQERVERERIEREKRLEKEKKQRDEIARRRAEELEREKQRAKELQEERELKANAQHLKQMIDKHNQNVKSNNQSLLTKTLSSSALNTTQTLNKSTTLQKSNTYELTPVKNKAAAAAPNQNPHNYDIDDRVSDESSDDEDAPKKAIPEWAKGQLLSSALYKQARFPPNLEDLFPLNYDITPDLAKIFPRKEKIRYKPRTSSAIWHTPPLKRF